MESHTTTIPGWGIDLSTDDRPGYPLEQEHFVGHDTLSGRPPYTDTVPLHGVSGIIRRTAYRYPDWKPRRWLLLMMADRIDTLESKLTLGNLLIAGTLGGLMLGTLLRRGGANHR